MRAPKSILITGASSGIGRALARAYAEPGTTLFLGGRDEARLAAAAAACEAAGAEAHARAIDATDAGAMAEWIAGSDRRAPLELVVANAGVSSHNDTDEAVRRLFAINVDGTLNTVLPALGPMRARGRGQIALMSSIAAFRGMPDAPAYCASKAATRVWAEGLRVLLAPEGVEVSAICPGFVETPMTDAFDNPKPFLMDADRAARIVRRGLAANRGRIAFPWQMHAAVWLLQALPPSVADALSGRRRTGRAAR